MIEQQIFDTLKEINSTREKLKTLKTLKQSLLKQLDDSCTHSFKEVISYDELGGVHEEYERCSVCLQTLKIIR